MLTHEEHRQRLKYINLADGKIAYVDEGEGPVVLLVHGVPTSSWLYRHIIPSLVEKGHRVIAPDLLGFGASEKPKGYEIYSEAAQGKRLLALMQQLGIDQWMHVCHDGGGLWTWEMLKQSSEGVSRLVLLNTIIYESGFDPPLRFEPGWIAKFYTFLYKGALSARLMIGATMKNGLSKRIKLSKKDKEGYWRPMREGGNRALYYFFTQTCNKLPDYYDDVLRSLSVPAMVIWGAKDPMLKWEPQAINIMADLRMDPADVHLLQEARHFIQEEQPEDIANWIDAFSKMENRGMTFPTMDG